MEIVAEIEHSDVLVVSTSDYDVVEFDVLNLLDRVGIREGNYLSEGILEFGEFEGIKRKLAQDAELVLFVLAQNLVQVALNSICEEGVVLFEEVFILSELFHQETHTLRELLLHAEGVLILNQGQIRQRANVVLPKSLLRVKLHYGHSVVPVERLVWTHIEYRELVLVRGIVDQKVVLVALHILELSHRKKVLNSVDGKDVLPRPQLEHFSEDTLPHVVTNQDSSLGSYEHLVP